jgi:FKBP-type peptidyl-prolyl cis-trans isomerase FkpA
MHEAAREHANHRQSIAFRQPPHANVPFVDELAPEFAVLAVGEAVTHRPHASAETMARLEDGDGGAALRELMRGNQAGQSSADDDDSLWPHTSTRSNGSATYNHRMRRAPFIVVVLLSAWGCAGDVSIGTAEENMAQSNITELIKADEVVGSGNEALSGRQVTVHYTGWLYDESRGDKKGRKFDSSRDSGDPFQFRLGAGQVIRGWDEGVAGMKVGGRRTLTIPPDFGYGARGAGGVIPPNATLVFDVELLDVR